MLHFLVGCFIVGTIVIWAIASPAFRTFLFIVIALIIGGGWWLIQAENKSTANRTAERNAAEYRAATAIKTSDLAFTDVKLTKLTYGPYFAVEGVVANKSAFNLETMWLKVWITDCVGTDCQVVGQEQASAAMKVPASQTRFFSTSSIEFKGLPQTAKGNRTWNYLVVALEAEK